MSSYVCTKFYFQNLKNPNDVVVADKEICMNYLKYTLYDMNAWDDKLENFNITPPASISNIIKEKEINKTDSIWFSLENLDYYLRQLKNEIEIESNHYYTLTSLLNSINYYKLNEEQRDSLHEDINYHKDRYDELLGKYNAASKLIGAMEYELERGDYDDYEIYVNCYIV